MKKVFYFGEKIKDYDVRVLNEREIRASAGILFFFALVAFMNSWLVGDFYLTKIFVIIFLIDFSIRIFVNPKFAPSLIIGRMVVQNQKPEYVGAPQKRFAWSIGFILASTMFFLVVINNVIGPINLFICLTCLIFLFFETSFGICLGCKVYNLFNKEKAKLCPGGTCDTSKKQDIEKVNFWQITIVALFFLSIFLVSSSDIIREYKIECDLSGISNCISFVGEEESNKDCEVPEWAIKLGHKEQYKLHHGCK